MSSEDIREYFNLHRIVTKEIAVTEEMFNRDPKIQMLCGRLNDLHAMYVKHLQEVNRKEI